jgi:hypothetical protein
LCDLAEEDWNGDELCDVLDCQGPSGIGHLAVTDGNGLFLGYLLDYEAEWGTSPPGTGYGKLEIYNPDIPGYFILSCASQSSSSPYIQGIASFDYFDFVSEDCSGAPPYINIGANPLGIFRDSYTDEFYVVDTTMPPISTDQFNSRLDFASGVCQTPYPGGYGGLAFPVKKISFPFAGALQQGNEVLQYPIRIGPVE